MQPQGTDSSCCCNGESGNFCSPETWMNPCSVGWYVSDKCEKDFWFRIKKDGVVIIGPSNANSYVLTPPINEVAQYSIEYCEGDPVTCVWEQIGLEVQVDTTGAEPCPMGVQGQTYVIGIRPYGSGEPEPTAWFLYCQSSIVVRASALADFGQQITHLWIDDTLFTPNTNFAGGLHTNPDGSLPDYAFHCGSGKSYGHFFLPANDTSLPQIRIPLPIPFSKETFSVRARQTDGKMIGCIVGVTCTSHYNAASITLPSWNGEEITCGASSGQPFGWNGVLLGGARDWCQNYSSSIKITPTGVGLPGTFTWITCQSEFTDPDLEVASYDCEYIFKWDGLIKWIDPDDTPPRPVYQGVFDLTMRATWSMKIYVPRTSTPGKFNSYGLFQKIIGDVTVETTGDFPIPIAVLNRLGLIDPRGTAVYSRCYYFTDGQYTGRWFTPTDHLNLDCDGLITSPGIPYDGDAFNWNWTGPQFTSDHWKVWKQFDDNWSQLDFSNHLVVVPGLRPYLNGVWPAGTNFDCDLPEGSYFTTTESGVATQFQV